MLSLGATDWSRTVNCHTYAVCLLSEEGRPACLDPWLSPCLRAAGDEEGGGGQKPEEDGAASFDWGSHAKCFGDPSLGNRMIPSRIGK